MQTTCPPTTVPYCKYLLWSLLWLKVRGKEDGPGGGPVLICCCWHLLDGRVKTRQWRTQRFSDSWTFFQLSGTRKKRPTLSAENTGSCPQGRLGFKARGRVRTRQDAAHFPAAHFSPSRVMVMIDRTADQWTAQTLPRCTWLDNRFTETVYSGFGNFLLYYESSSLKCVSDNIWGEK